VLIGGELRFAGELEVEHSSLEAAYIVSVSKEKETSASLRLFEIRYAAASADKAELQNKVVGYFRMRGSMLILLFFMAMVSCSCYHAWKHVRCWKLKSRT
jgi:hypothetical protein